MLAGIPTRTLTHRHMAHACTLHPFGLFLIAGGGTPVPPPFAGNGRPSRSPCTGTQDSVRLFWLTLRAELQHETVAAIRLYLSSKLRSDTVPVKGFRVLMQV